MVTDLTDPSVFRRIWLENGGTSFDARPIYNFGIVKYLTKLEDGVDVRTGEQHDKMTGRTWGGARHTLKALRPLHFVNFPTQGKPFTSSTFYEGFKTSEKLRHEIIQVYKDALYGSKY